MTPDLTTAPGLTTATMRLADIIERENTALRAFDLAAAGTLLAEKNAAADAFVAAQSMNAALIGLDRREIGTLANRLRQLAAENKTLLEQAIAVQGRVIGIVALVGRSTLARAAPRYGASGRPAEAPPAAFALSARA